MSRVELPSGAWVELCETTKVTERQRRPVRLALQRLTPEAIAYFDGSPDKSDAQALMAAITPADAEVMYDVNDLVAANVVATASFLVDGATCTVDDVLNLEGRDYDAVLAATAPFIGAFMGVDFDTRPPDGERPADSPT